MRAMTPQTFIFMGRSGSGKGTQTDLLMKKIAEDSLPQFRMETGPRFRTLSGQEGNYTSDVLRDLLKNGGLPAEFLAIYVWTTELIERAKKEQHWFFDGVCRRPVEAPVFADALKFYGRGGNSVHVLYLDVTNEWSTERLLARARGFGDDKPELIARRLQWFERDVLPAIEYLRDKSGFHFCKINGEQTIEQVHSDILRAVAKNV